jgi:hypothetical protein
MKILLSIFVVSEIILLGTVESFNGIKNIIFIQGFLKIFSKYYTTISRFFVTHTKEEVNFQQYTNCFVFKQQSLTKILCQETK